MKITRHVRTRRSRRCRRRRSRRRFYRRRRRRCCQVDISTELRLPRRRKTVDAASKAAAAATADPATDAAAADAAADAPAVPVHPTRASIQLARRIILNRRHVVECGRSVTFLLSSAGRRRRRRRRCHLFRRRDGRVFIVARVIIDDIVVVAVVIIVIDVVVIDVAMVQRLGAGAVSRRGGGWMWTRIFRRTFDDAWALIDGMTGRGRLPVGFPGHFRVLHNASVLRFPVGFIVVLRRLILILIFVVVVVSSSAVHGLLASVNGRRAAPYRAVKRP